MTLISLVFRYILLFVLGTILFRIISNMFFNKSGNKNVKKPERFDSNGKDIEDGKFEEIKKGKQNG